MESSMEVPQKTKNKIAIWSSNPTPGNICGENYNLKRDMNSMFIATLFPIVKTWEQLKAISRWMDKEDVVHISTMEYYSVIKRVKGCSDTDGPGDYHTKWRESDRDQDHTIPLTWNLTYGTNGLIYKTETDSQTQNRLVVVKGEAGWGRDGQGVWD